jgi:hypothetical protein
MDNALAKTLSKFQKSPDVENIGADKLESDMKHPSTERRSYDCKSSQQQTPQS